MNLTSFIARRYLRSPKSHSVVNLISWVAGVAIAVPTAAMVVILSLHNGLTDKIEELFNSFDSPIRITSVEGKYFDPTWLDIQTVEGVDRVSYIIEDNVLVRRGEREHLATMRGVDTTYGDVIEIKNLIKHGSYELTLDDQPQAVIGQGIAYNLGISTWLLESVDIYSIRPDRGNSILPTPIFKVAKILPVGIFELDEQTDGRYIIVPLAFAQELLGFAGKVSAAEVSLAANVNPEVVKTALEVALGSAMRVETRFEQKASLYRAINQEKWVIYLLLMMVLVIASLSLAGSIVILISDKKQQITTLATMGATTKMVRAIFRRQGVFITTFGAISGLIIGTGLALVQQFSGAIKMAGETMLLDAYPVRVSGPDLLMIMAGVVLMGWAISAITTRIVLKASSKKS